MESNDKDRQSGQPAPASGHLGRDAPTQELARLPLGLLVGVAIAVLVILSLAGYSLWQSRINLQREAENQTENLANVLERYVYTAIHEGDLALQVSAGEYRRWSQSGHPRDEAYSSFLEDLRQRLPHLQTLRASDARGQIIHGVGIDPAKPINIADLDRFEAARNTSGLAITAPIVSRSNQQWVLPITRRLETGDGRFGGVVVANIEVRHFGDLFASLHAGRHATLLLFDANTDIYIRHPEPKGPGSVLGLKVGSPQFKALWQQGQRSGTYQAQSTTDGIRRTYSYRQVGDYPLYVMVGVAEDDYLLPWQAQFTVTAVFLGGLALLVTMLGRSLGRSLRARRQAYLDLAESREHLRVGEHRYRALFDHMQTGFALHEVILDESGQPVDYVFLAANENYGHITGFDTRAIIGKRVAQVYPDFAQDLSHDSTDWRREFREVALGGGARHIESFMRGLRRWVDVVAYQPQAGQVAILVADITERKQAEQALRRESEKNLALLHGASDGIHILDLEGHLLEASDSFCSMLGYRCEEMARMTVSDWDAQYAPAELALIIRQQHAQPQRSVFETLHRRKDGSILHVEISGLPLELEGRPVMFYSSRDISERKRIEAELEQHQRHLEDLVQRRTDALIETEARASHILQSSADGLYGTNPEGRISFINPAGCAMLGYSAEQVIGQPAHPLFHHSKPDGSPYPAEECPSHASMRRGQEVRVDTEVYWHADGHAVPVMYAVHPMIQNGVVTGAVTSFVDVSTQRAAAQAREQALVVAENLARMRSEFLANMSHEIRTPLNGVLGFAQIGHRNSQDSDKARNAFARILSSGTLLLKIIDDILDFSKIEAGKLNVEQTETSPVEVVNHAIDLVRERARGKNLDLRIEFATDLPRTCLSDPLRLGQILLNLLSNAVKFTEEGGITLSVQPRNDELVFRISDTGIGMSEEQMGQLFNPFQQADGSTTRRFGGTGLGLAISKRLLELMGGDIRVESQVGVGTRFEFWLPLVRSAAPGSGESPGQIAAGVPDEKPLTGMSILAAEDDLVNQMVLEETLTEAGAHVVMAANGREAVERVICDGPDAYQIVLMDLQMPEMDGYEATRRILALVPDMPIIGQSALALEEEGAKCVEVGMIALVAKPTAPAALVSLLLQHAGIGDGS
ncbi:MAG: PAS domain S-box protein [Rhodocyclaceae bacterium]|nr:PAS domain S-box protein [Rhodocyclaceae bacterium]